MNSREKWVEIASRDRPSWYLDPLVASQKRQIHLDLVRSYVGACKPLIVLKTDLFEEAYGEDALLAGLFPDATLRMGVDLSFPTAARAASRTDPAACLLAADVRRLPFRSSCVDLILSNSTLDHFETRKEFTAALTELTRVLKPDGVLIVTLDNPLNPLYWPLRWITRCGGGPYPLGYTRSGSALVKDLEQCGLRVGTAGTLIHNPRVVSTVSFLLLRRVFGNRADSIIQGLLRWTAKLECLPTRNITACFVSACAIKPTSFGHRFVEEARQSR